MFTRSFWLDTGTRALRTFAQTLLAVLGAGALDVLHTDWAQALSVSVGAALLCVLTCIALPGANR